MKAEPLAFAGAVLLRGEFLEDERGSFRRAVDAAQLEACGLEPHIEQASVAFNHRRGTVRGFHYQVSPHEESKTLWCSSGSVYEVLVDLRPHQPTYGQWLSVTLSAGEPVSLHVPPGVAHGYQTLADNTELVYLISAPYVEQSARVLLWRDETLAVPWPLPAVSISERDREAPSWPPQF